jgi:hypothetical protein|tara:strand:+ start:326 stop:490 length:165 start_codon:yes stop_codon:yes gene_type:complete
MENQIPKEYQSKFNSFEEFRLYSVEVAKKKLEQAFEKIEIDESKNRKENIKTNQ